MKYLFITIFIFFSSFYETFAQNLQVETLMDLNASGGVTIGPDGNVYVSDFGPALGTASVNTKVYKIEYGSWEVTEFASGFSGASGSRFDSQGNFYQSNPSGARVSKRSPDGTLNLDWVTEGMSGGPIGIVHDEEDNLYICNCGANTIRKVSPDGTSTLFANSSLFNCPNGITRDPNGNLYVCNFSDGRIIKITPDGIASSLTALPVNNFVNIGNGHITYSNGFLFVATIGTGQIFKLSLSGEQELIAGVAFGYSNTDGPALEATFSKPNGIAASITGDTLWVNCSSPSWLSNPNALHPGVVRMITGVCSLEDVNCPLLTSIKTPEETHKNQFATLLTPMPNPVNSETTLAFEIHQNADDIRLKINDASLKTLSTIFEGRVSSGKYTFPVLTKDWAAGIYYINLESDKYILTQKMVIVR